MKTCKKILAGILVFAMMMSMCAFVSAEDTETATNVLLTLHDFNSAATGTYKTGTAANDGLNKAGLNFRAIKYDSNGITSGTVAERAEGDNYLVAQSNWFGYNYRKSDTVFNDTYGAANYPVLSISYDIMIPNDVDYKTFKRYGSLTVGTTKTGNYTTAATVYPTIEDGEISVTADNSTDKYSKSLDYTYGSWVNFKTLVWVNTSSKLNIAVFADDTLVYYGTGTKAVTGLAMADMNFGYCNNLDGTARVSDATAANWSNGIHTDATTGEVDSVVSTTCYDNITVQLLQESEKVSEDYVNGVIVAEKAATPYVTILDLPADSLADITDSSYAENITDDAETGIRTVVASKAGDIIPATGLTSSRLVQGSSTKAESKYQIITEGDRTYLSAKSTNYQYMSNTMRKSFADYVRNNDTHTFVGKYDMYVPSTSPSAERSHTFNFTLDAASSGTYKRIISDLDFKSIIKDGKIEFNAFGDNQGTDVNGAERSEARDFPADTWKTVTYVIEITHGAESYAVDTFGIYDNEVIYVNSHIITYEDFNEDGITDELGFNADNFYVTPETIGTEVETCIDNVSFVKNNNFDWTGINTDAWVNRRVELTLDADGNVDVDASKKEGTFDSGILVIALYDANGKLIEILKSTEITDGKFVYEVPATKVATASLIKGFVFDGITTAVPQFPHGALIIE